MTEEPLKPQSLGNSPPDPPTPKPSSVRSLWILAAGVVLVGFGVISWLANRTDPVPPPSQATPTPPPQATATPDPALRRGADRALEELLAVAGPLKQTDPELWGGGLWTRFQEQSGRGDDLLAEQQWAGAEEAYTEALRLARQLTGEMENAPDTLYEQAYDAYSRGEAEGAVRRLKAVLAIDPEHQKAKDLMPRAESADQTFARMQAATQRKEEGKWELAYAEVNKVMAADPQFPGAEELRKEIEDQLTATELQTLLGRALIAMDAGDLETAEAALQEAVTLSPDDPAVVDARKQIQAKVLETKILKLREEATSLKAQEKWKAAYSKWLEIKALDPDAPWVRKGLADALRWAVIHEKILKGLENPASPQTEEWVSDFQTREGWPSALADQAEQLVEKHRAWTTPVPVIITSDGETEITLPRKGRWSNVVRKQIDLLPGRYVAKGGRLGYRDVRVEFEVPPGEEEVVVTVVCTEGI